MGILDIFRKKPEKDTIIAEFNSKHQKNPYSDDYYIGMDKIETAWAVITNLKHYNSPEADALEKACLENIEQYKNMIDFDTEMEPPHHVPAIVRLAMLYEKQERYEEGIKICTEAIRLEAVEDHTKGKIYGRLARLIHKAGNNIDYAKLTGG